MHEEALICDAQRQSSCLGILLLADASVSVSVSPDLETLVCICEKPPTGMSALQESEGEEAAESRVTLAQSMGRGNIAERQSRVKLQEVNACAIQFCTHLHSMPEMSPPSLLCPGISAALKLQLLELQSGVACQTSAPSRPGHE